MESCVLKLTYCSTIDQIKIYLPANCGIVVFIDASIQKSYGKYFPYPQIPVKTSEENKSFKTIEELTLKLLDMGAERSTFLLAVGGGILSDLTGFLASIYMRGVKFGYVPTTLLSQVDAAIGGKTAVNVLGYKNILGVINQPQFTIFCPEFLESLPEKELKAGVAELLKTFILADRESYFSVIGQITEKGYDIEALWPFIQRASKIKADIVESDPYENGARSVLNLGHTFAHALEKVAEISHGEAVSIGIVLAAKLSVNLGILKNKEKNTIESDFKRIGLSTTSPVPHASLVEAIIRDKKRNRDSIRFIIIEKIGKASTYPLEINKLEDYLNDLS
ncbi:MAG: 3-dehydroquinate synthase family protein [Rikenellaceae bacterium]